jgi:hypothetical protein
MVFQVAAMRATGLSDIEAAVNRVAGIVVASTNDLVAFAWRYVGTILLAHAKSIAGQPSEIIPAEYLEETSIPPVTVRAAAESGPAVDH